MPITPIMEAAAGAGVTVSSALTEAKSIFDTILSIATSNLIFMIPIGIGLLGGGVCLFKRLKK